MHRFVFSYIVTETNNALHKNNDYTANELKCSNCPKKNETVLKTEFLTHK